MIKLKVINKSQLDESSCRCETNRKRIKFDSNNISISYEKVSITKSLSQGAEKDKKQSFDWRKVCRIIVVTLKVLIKLFFITPPLFNMLC